MQISMYTYIDYVMVTNALDQHSYEDKLASLSDLKHLTRMLASL